MGRRYAREAKLCTKLVAQVVWASAVVPPHGAVALATVGSIWPMAPSRRVYMSYSIEPSTERDASSNRPYRACPPREARTGAAGRFVTDWTAAPHCSAESRNRRRGIAASGVQLVVPPAP